MYFYDNRVVEYINAEALEASQAEVTDLNHASIWSRGELNVELLGQELCMAGIPARTKVWWMRQTSTSGTWNSTNCKIACPEIAYLNGWITREEVLEIYEVLKKNQYGQYLKDVLDGKYIDAIGENKHENVFDHGCAAFIRSNFVYYMLKSDDILW